MRVLLSCGEPSGDLYAGALAAELRALMPGIVLAGMGGPRFAAAGGRILEDYRGLAVTGLAEAVPKLAKALAARRLLAAHARDARPDAIVLIDSPDFNLRLAAAVRRLGLDIPIVYYISPQIWAWRPGRLATIRRLVNRMIVIFPFEEAIYREAGVPVEFVGHPLVDLVTPSQPRETFLGRLGLEAQARTVAVLPGSRPNEVGRILPELMRACRLVAARIGNAQFVVARAPDLDDRLFEAADPRGDLRLAVVQGETDAVLAAADVTLTASGTATVQAALHDTPMVVVYRLSALTYRAGRPLVNVSTFGMVNLIAGRRIVPELIQDGFTAEAVAAEAMSLLGDQTRAGAMRRDLAEVRAKLGGPGASRRAAHAVLRAIRGEP